MAFLRGFVGVVLYLYDSIITLDRELVCFWTNILTGAPLLFIANKWINVVVNAMSLAGFAFFSSDQVSGQILSLARLILMIVRGSLIHWRTQR